MRRSVLGWSAGLAVGAVGLLLSASAAWACLGLAGITTNAATVQPGGTVTVHGYEFSSAPVMIHLDSIGGPVLATAKTDSARQFDQSVTIPAGTAQGEHVLIATEGDPAAGTSPNGVPARVVVQVGTAAPTSPAAPARSVSLAASSGTSTGTLVLIGVIAAAASLVLAAGVSLVASRRRPQAEAVKAS